MHKRPERPWVKMETNLFETEGRTFLIITDYFSSYPIIRDLRSITSADVIAATKETFGMLVIPREMMSDNGPQFFSSYNSFCTEWGMMHMTSSRRHPQLNGFIKRQIHCIKPIIKKCLRSKMTSTWLYSTSELHHWMQHYQALPK